MASPVNTDELFLDLLRETIVEAIDDSRFEIEHDNGCRHGCCPREYHFVDGTEAREFADEVIHKLISALEETK